MDSVVVRDAEPAEGRVVGFITTASSADGLEVDDLFVDPRWMRRGSGERS